MKSLHREQPFSYKELLYKCAISLVTVAVIVYFLPKEGKFNYQFDINKPWKYGLLQASFDFPIYKGDEQIQKEQDSLMEFYQPYYEIDKTQGEQMIQKFKDDYNKNLRNIIPVPAYQHHIERILEVIYEKGVVSMDDLASLKKEAENKQSSGV